MKQVRHVWIALEHIIEFSADQTQTMQVGLSLGKTVEIHPFCEVCILNQLEDPDPHGIWQRPCDLLSGHNQRAAGLQHKQATYLLGTLQLHLYYPLRRRRQLQAFAQAPTLCRNLNVVKE